MMEEPEKAGVSPGAAAAAVLEGMAGRNGSPLTDAQSRALGQAMEGLFAASSGGSLCVTADDLARLGAEGDVLALLAETDLVLVNDKGLDHSEFRPLVIDRAGGSARLYTARGFELEKSLAAMVSKFALPRREVLQPDDAPGEQQRAVEMARANRLTIVSGGPGTGKTWTVVRILAALRRDDPGCTAVLLAPTGKAASRIRQSINAAVEGGGFDGETAEWLQGLPTSTMHKILTRALPDGSRPGPGNPLPYSVVIVDESSMVSIDLAVWFFSALDPAWTRVVLLGDRNQLAAVDPGSFFADVCERGGPLAANTALFTKSYRFGADKRVGKLAAAICAGRVDEAKDILAGPADPGGKDNAIAWHRGKPPGGEALTAEAEEWINAMVKALDEATSEARSHAGEKDLEKKAAKAACDALSSFGALCSNRSGPMSVDAVNRRVEERLAALGFPKLVWRQIIARRNDPAIGVSNGDVGLTIPGGRPGSPLVFFPGTGLTIGLGIIPKWDEAFAITIHQSQGSEYHRVAVFLPNDEDSPLATRELLYTAVTRVKDRDGAPGSLDIFGSPKALEKAVKTPTERSGGLRVRLSEEVRKASSGEEQAASPSGPVPQGEL